jgi:hypothetical protein
MANARAERARWVSYLRVSTVEQAEKELSLTAQRHYAEEFAARHDTVIDHHYVEPGASCGSTPSTCISCIGPCPASARSPGAPSSDFERRGEFEPSASATSWSITSRNCSATRTSCVVGSIAGLSVAVALRRLGADVAVLERGAVEPALRGEGLGVSLGLCRALARAPGDVPRHMVHQRRRLWIQGAEHEEPADIAVTSYSILWRWLREQLPASVLEFGQSVVLIDSKAGRPRVTTSDARARSFDLVVAADGGASDARRHVLGSEAQATFAGYVLWRGLVSSSAVALDRAALSVPLRSPDRSRAPLASPRAPARVFVGALRGGAARPILGDAGRHRCLRRAPARIGRVPSRELDVRHPRALAGRQLTARRCDRRSPRQNRHRTPRVWPGLRVGLRAAGREHRRIRGDAAPLPRPQSHRSPCSSGVIVTAWRPRARLLGQRPGDQQPRQR